MEINKDIIKKNTAKVTELISFFCDNSAIAIEEAFVRYELNREKFEFIFGLAESQVVIESDREVIAESNMPSERELKVLQTITN